MHATIDIFPTTGTDPNGEFTITRLLQEMAVNIHFQRNGRTVYSGTTFVGHMFIINGVKEGQYAFSFNARLSDTSHGAGVRNLLKWVVGLAEGDVITTATRRVFEEANTFEEAKHFLSTVPMVNYFLGN